MTRPQSGHTVPSTRFTVGKSQRVLMRKLVASAAVLLGAVWFIASPFLASWELRQAIRTGDTATLEKRVEWPSVRASLRQSFDEVQKAITELSDAAGVPKPSLWQRIVSATVPMLSGTVIDRYVTPAGLPQLYAWRETWRNTVRPTIGLTEPPMALAGTTWEGTALDKVVTVLRRVDRAAFVSPTRVELELRDRYVNERSYRAVWQLKGWTWKLTELYVRRVPKPTPPAANATS
jgi:hypothetical protein